MSKLRRYGLASRPVDLGRRRLLAGTLVGCAVLTLVGYLLKAQCIPDYNADRDRLLCSNDIQVLYLVRGMAAHPFPYVHGALVGHRLVGGALARPHCVAWRTGPAVVMRLGLLTCASSHSRRLLA